ncbi:MAG: TSUP family transporter [Methylovirgula sp.]
MHPEMLVVLALGAGLAGFVDTIAGGGGLITLPLLLLSGLPPIAALATNKLQGSFGTLVATLTLLARRQIVLAEIGPGFAMAFCGGLIGALAVRWTHPKALDVLIPIVLGAIALYFLFAPKAGEIAGKARLAPALYRRLVVPAIGFYDGFFGPGTGSFFALAGVALRGETLLRATAFAKVLNFGSNLAAFLIFLLAGKVVWLAGAAMVCGQILGAYAGAHAVIRGGARLIRPLIVVICFAMLARYAWQKGLFAGGF